MIFNENKEKWIDGSLSGSAPYVCARKSTPTVATGGEMLGCAGGRWVLGAPYKQSSSLGRLPPTIVSALTMICLYLLKRS